MDVVMLVGRILFAFMFVMSGFNHLAKAEAMAGYAAYKKVPAPKLANLLSGVLMLLGGLSIILGVYADLGALVLAILLVAMAVKMHDFWSIVLVCSCCNAGLKHWTSTGQQPLVNRTISCSSAA